MAVWKRYHYKCNNNHCRAQDSIVMLGDEPAPMVVQCYKCHNGQNKSLDQQLMGKLGMVRTEQEPEVWDSSAHGDVKIIDIEPTGQVARQLES